MQAVNRNPDRATVRRFGAIMLVGFAAIGAVLWYAGRSPASPWAFSGSLRQAAAIVSWGMGGAFAVTCLASHRLGRLLYVGWMTVGMCLGAVTSTILLSILFIILLPAFSLIRFKDPLRLKLRRDGSYWEAALQHEPTLERVSRMF